MRTVPFCAVNWFTAAHVPGAFGACQGDAQPDAAGRPAALAVEPGVALLDGDLVAEEPCCLGAAVLGLGKLQLEAISQELPYPVLDFLGQSEQEVVGIPYVPQARYSAWVSP